MEDTDTLPHHPGRGMYDDLARKVACETDIVVPEHDLDRSPLGKKATEELEDDRTERRREAHDRMLHISRDDQCERSVGMQEANEAFGERICRPFRRTPGPVRAPTEAEMQVGDHDGPGVVGSRPPEQKRRLVGDRSQGAFHAHRNGRATLTLGVPEKDNRDSVLR